jgi:hypothetical protein
LGFVEHQRRNPREHHQGAGGLVPAGARPDDVIRTTLRGKAQAYPAVMPASFTT